MKEQLTFVAAAMVAFIAAVNMPATAGTDDAGDRVAKILSTVKPFDSGSRDAAEEALVAGGPALVPAIRAAMERAEETQRDALDGALVRITWKGDPRKKVAAWMAEKAGVAAGRLPAPVHISSPALDALFPEKLFYAAIARQYPHAVLMPPPFAARNVLVYEKDESVKLFNQPEELIAYFRRVVPPLSNPGAAQRVAVGWLRLTQEFSQDGFFRFTVPDDQIKANWQESGGLVVTGKAVVVPKGGDSGEITATLTFGGQGNGPRRLVRIEETRNVKAGVRPICQATKLLDRDPIVRKMAKQDILVMGRAAWPYIESQRKKASPALRRAIEQIWQRVLDEGR